MNFVRGIKYIDMSHSQSFRRPLVVPCLLVALLAPWTATWTRAPFQLKPAELTAIGFVFLWILSALVKGKVYVPPGFPSLVGIVGISVLSLVVSRPPPQSGFEWATALYSPGLYSLTVVGRQVLYFSLYMGIISSCVRRASIVLVLKSYLVGGVIAGLIGLGQMSLFVLRGSTVGVFMTPWDPVPRVLGTFNEPGPYSTFLATVVVILTAFLVSKNSVRVFARTHVYLFVALSSTALLLTFSSRGLIEAMIGIGFVLVAERKVNISSLGRAVVVFGVVIVVLGLAFPPFPQGFVWAFEKVRAEWLLDPAEAHGGGRKAGLYIAPRMFAQNPLLGVGIGNYPFLRNEFANEVPVVWHLDRPGNVFLEFLAETGILGLLAFSAFIVSTVVYVTRGSRHVRYDVGMFHGLSAACIVLLLDLGLSSSLYLPYVWLLPGLLVSLVRASRL
jgi:O-antigen ligase